MLERICCLKKELKNAINNNCSCEEFKDILDYKLMKKTLEN